VKGPNDLWTVDFKGWWQTRDGSRAEPLTVRDAFSRYVLSSELVTSTATDLVRPEFERLFERYGLPRAIQVDNGSPFACTRSLGGLTRLSAWWVSLGVKVIRGRPAHPEDNGGHERMHLDMKFDVEDVPASDLDAQRAALHRWRHEFNHVRPHEALEQRVPADVYRKSTRRYLGMRKAWYPAGFTLRQVSGKGMVKYRGRSHYISLALCGYSIAVRALNDTTAEMRFYDLDLGTLDLAA
jgi:transposase InsO family protein